MYLSRRFFSLLPLLAAIAAVTACPARGQTVERVSLGIDGRESDGASGFDALSISLDGRFVAFRSNATNLIPDDTNAVYDVFVRDRATGEIVRASVDSAGRQANGNSGAYGVSMSADGRTVAFVSSASNLVTDDVNGMVDVFVHDVVTGETSRMSGSATGEPANGTSESVAVSASGRWVVFNSSATNLVASDANGQGLDVFVRDRLTNETSLVSVSSTGEQGNGDSRTATISADGRWVVFVSAASNLVSDDRNGVWDVFVRDRAAGTTSRVSEGSDGVEGNGHSYYAMASADARYVVFVSYASNLVPSDTNGCADVFENDRETGETVRVSVDSYGTQADGSSSYPSISADGRVTAYRSDATDLVGDDTNERTDVFVHDRENGTTTRLSTSADGQEGNGNSGLQSRVSISPDGHHIAFGSDATNLVANDTNGWSDVFVSDHFTVRLTAIVPSVGSEDGGDIVHVYGTDFTTASDTSLWFGNAAATILDVSATRIDARTPAGDGRADVVLSNFNGTFMLDGGYDYVDPSLAARYGNVNVARGDRENVLLVNALAGDDVLRDVLVSTGQPLSVVVANPSNRMSARFVLYAWSGEGDPTTVAILPRGLGTMALPPPFVPSVNPPRITWNNLGRPRILGAATRVSRPAPSIVFSRATGVRHAATLTLQGLIEDDAAGSAEGLSVTNAIVLRVH
ncbi:MAG: PD40 domain-containing protein [Planctomycetes bacterium]|nr:PD40 domain-containing protein [Planctomycetota bacterium]MBI3845367.1 PD40 domain-containing protein [Planctomycetota bacterium]